MVPPTDTYDAWPKRARETLDSINMRWKIGRQHRHLISSGNPQRVCPPMMSEDYDSNASSAPERN